jgi:Holliday junction resolvasome RuvABC endonuclease subunit
MTAAPLTPVPATAGAVAGTGLCIVGLDLSLSATGIACILGATATTRHLKAGGTGHERMDAILADLAHVISLADVVAVEGPSYGSGTKGRQSGHHERAGLWWLVTHVLLRGSGTPFAVIPPASAKKYATSKGNAGKADMLIAAVRRLPEVDVKDDNEADALWIAAMAADHYGCPIVAMPQANRAALDVVDWPVLVQLAGTGGRR